MKRSALAVAFFVLTCAAAYAQAQMAPAWDGTRAVPAAPATVDLRPWIDGVVMPLLQALLLPAVLWGWYKLAALFKLKINEKNRETFDQVASVAVGLALKQLQGKLPDQVPVDVKNAALRDAAIFVQQRGPAAMKALGIDPADIPQMLEARLHAAANTAAAAVVTPDGATATATATAAAKPPSA